jgi:uncharacterized protein YjiK
VAALHVYQRQVFTVQRLYPYRIPLSGLLLALLLVTAAGQQHLALERLWYGILEHWHADARKEASLWLPAYQVDIEAKPITGHTDLSALTFDPSRQTLASLTNKSSHFIELSLDGEIVRQIPMQGFNDPEAIEYIRPGVFVVVEERQQRLIQIHVDDNTRVIDASDPRNQTQLSLSVSAPDNRGFEGLAYDSLRKRLYLAKEKDPVQIYEIDGFADPEPGTQPNVTVRADLDRDESLFLEDLSSLYFSATTNHLLALSDESRVVLELDSQGKPVSMLPLDGGQHGLKNSVPQAEGLAMDNQGTLYLVSEPNLFYRFKRR